MFFSPIDPVWVALILVSFSVICGLCFCLTETVKTGQKILTEQQEHMSEEDKERMSKRKKKGEKEKGKEKGGKIKGIGDKEKEIVKRYLSLKDLSLSSSASSDSELNKDDEADLEEESARYERERYDLDWSYRTKPMKRGALANKRTKPKVPTASPYNPDYTGEKKSARAVRPGISFCPEVWKEIGLTFPGFVDGQGQRYHEPVDFKTIKQLAESVRTYGVSAAFVVAQVEVLARYCLTLGDWNNIAWVCLSSSQYLDWRSLSYEHANSQAAANLATGQDPQRHWDEDMFLGLGHFALDQTNYPEAVYAQINEVATKAWKALQKKGAVSGNLTKVLQGPTETFSDFVALLFEAATRIFGDPDTAMPLVKQLVYEQCTKECRAAITPYKHKGLEVWMKVCRELGGPLTNVGLAAAVVQLGKSNDDA
jgi:hypothetical protein